MRRLLSVLLALLGGAMIIYGGRDDSPGMQVLGVILGTAGVVSALRKIPGR